MTKHWPHGGGIPARRDRVLLADGKGLTLPDTPENQRAYPQPTSQQPGLGFSIIRLVMLLTIATAAIVGPAFGRYAGKTALVRELSTITSCST